MNWIIDAFDAVVPWIFLLALVGGFALATAGVARTVIAYIRRWAEEKKR